MHGESLLHIVRPALVSHSVSVWVGNAHTGALRKRRQEILSKAAGSTSDIGKPPDKSRSTGRRVRVEQTFRSANIIDHIAKSLVKLIAKHGGQVLVVVSRAFSVLRKFLVDGVVVSVASLHLSAALKCRRVGVKVV
ncbi:hypothetical protein RSOL_143550 [Rhizoctonia solani AG-3 Rhs1AP]|uniref:Uncharacterized protein n=2 Tax=Rhizoctonia solani AG-3 TaxID=1086053 RepID=A0A074RV58_9AGAM|nr:hypothetical protein RSOL_143550 [Rhizoctonia solani AG-3 Rhs1AP]KEP48533.1 hypothetical protein V565_122220 [Rhizoctonia solani 123E]